MEIKPMTKSELAWLYSPHISQTAALNRLNRWINNDAEIMNALTQAGYRAYQRILTPRQVHIILDALGDPHEVCDIY